nr:flavin reductase [Lachnospiraceae bacterium]
NPDKMKINLDIGKGEVLNVPILNNSPVNFELEVTDSITKGDGEIMLCEIRNVLQDESLSSEGSVAEKLSRIAPIKTTAKTYLGYDGRDLSSWGEPMKTLG